MKNIALVRHHLNVGHVYFWQPGYSNGTAEYGMYLGRSMNRLKSTTVTSTYPVLQPAGWSASGFIRLFQSRGW